METMRLEVRDHVAWLTFSRPQAANTFGPAFVKDLYEGIRSFAEKRAPRFAGR